jgi:murein DD-endopeptidase MepM/ murein hydrolase activator NlpD
MNRALWVATAPVAVSALLALGSCNDGDARLLTTAPVPQSPLADASRPAASFGPVTPARPATFELRGELTQGGWLRGLAPGGTRKLALDGNPVPLAADGSFIVAFDRDAGTTARLVAERAGGDIVARDLAIATRAWQIEHVAVGPRPGSQPSEEFQRIRAAELGRISAARSRETGATGWRQDFVWPARGRISGRFGSQRIYRGTPGAYHSGLDIAGGGGTPFVAPADGVVILAAERPFTLEGNLLMIDHGMGLNSAFLHCSELLVREGEQVRQGQVIGRIGATGRATGPHLHWSIKWREARLDPLLFIGAPSGPVLAHENPSRTSHR